MKQNIDEELIDRLKLLKAEDIIWTILIGLLLLSFYANKLEREYLIYDNHISKEKYRHLQIFIFVVATLTYLFYALHDFQDLFKLKPTDNPEKIQHTYLSFIASVFVLTAGCIFIYIAVTDTELETEISL
ncbi:MAG: hypothetical protein MR598_08525 [Erysipelotrichaceae bacterium]|nr:hypothetical protein [Erysipelotrichaceae bacterium]